MIEYNNLLIDPIDIRYPFDPLPINSTGAIMSVNGQVLDEFGNPLPGASVHIVNTPTIGVSTDFDGYFTLEVPSLSTLLEIRYLGYKTQQIAASQANSGVILKEDTENLNEVVITATLPQPPAPKTDNTLMYVGIAAAALVLGYLANIMLTKKTASAMAAPAKPKVKRHRKRVVKHKPKIVTI